MGQMVYSTQLITTYYSKLLPVFSHFHGKGSSQSDIAEQTCRLRDLRRMDPATHTDGSLSSPNSAAILGIATAVRIQYKVGASSTMTATFHMRIVTDHLPSTFLVSIPSFYQRSSHSLIH